MGNLSADLDQFFISDKESDAFLDPVFVATSDFHGYLMKVKKDEDYIDKYEAINSIVDCYSDLRSIAENEAKKSDYLYVRKASGALPISLDQIFDYFQGGEEKKEPPLRLIVKIATEQYDLVRILSGKLNKVLQRDRQQTPIGKAQQLDTQCMRWLSRQPGITPMEKAGAKQKILSVVRYETFDTLENRVFKAFLKRCFINGESYIHDYAMLFPDSKRVAEVRRYLSLVKRILSDPVFLTIRTLRSVPRPNYVLQNNVRYRIIWKLFLQLVNKTRLMEIIWKQRNLLLREFAKMVFLSYCHKRTWTPMDDLSIVHNLWVDQFASGKGCFLAHSNWNYLDYNERLDLVVSSIDRDSRFRFQMGESLARVIIKTALIPEHSGVVSSTSYRSFCPIVFYEGEPLESRGCGLYCVKLDSGIVQNLCNIIDGITNKLRKKE